MTPPTKIIEEGISDNRTAASIVAPTGSPSKETLMTYAGRYFKDQLKRVCPNIVDTTARAANKANSSTG